MRPGARAVDIDFDHHALARDVGHQHRVGMRIAGDVIELDLHRLICISLFAIHCIHHQPVRFLGQRIGLKGVRAARDLFDPLLVAGMRDDVHALGDRGAQARGVIEVVMRGHDLRERLVRDGFLRLGDHRERARFALRRVDQHQVIAELDQGSVMRAAGQEPHAFANRLHDDVDRRCGRARSGDGRGRRELADFGIDRLARRADFGSRKVVHLGGKARGQAQSAHVLEIAKRRGHDHVAEIGLIRL